MREPMNEASIGVVVIGRNEGERLRACLASVASVAGRIYVDSGSTDGSTALARTLGFNVVDLDTKQPFTAARARNAGMAALLHDHPQLDFIQTVDGDCVIDSEWLAVASADMAVDARRAVVFGRRRERRPEANAYHAACDDEWNVPLGEVKSCGGDALLRVTAIREVGGYDDSLIAGEEPEMCLRLRERGWRIWSNGEEMTLHDVAITLMKQWWHRSRRTGYAFAELVDLHKSNADPSWRRLLRSSLGWTAINTLALTGILVAIFEDGTAIKAAALVPAIISAIQLLRMANSKRHSMGWIRSGQWSALMMIAKLAQTAGWLRYKQQSNTGARSALIEYKT
ncbi:glycosyltransferase family 2 protein [Sphingomonas phyllosphaerae]|uniref:glycosyltransferase family 2 protein n=1 Tax=Sphingomonas phyllosphaerae TaxID=257003 RepID=UPI0024138300|nr:glycosyltransferase [Sphingomonas phyllosphaerae]